MAKARAHIPIILAKISSDRRFDHVTLDEFTGGLGSILMTGEVRSQADLNSLKSVVAATSPPTVVIYHIDIRSENDLLKLDAAGASTSRPTTWPYY